MLTKVTAASFGAQVLHSQAPAVLVKFSADWCQPCKVLSATLDDLKPELGDHVHFVEIDVDQEPELANQYGVRGLPTMALFKKGQILATKSGNDPKPKVRSWIIDQLGL